MYLFHSAHTEYSTAWNKGSDGPKKDFYARKSCNYITRTIEVILIDSYCIIKKKILKTVLKECSDKLKDCMNEEELTAYKNYQYDGVLETVQASAPNWDSEKCPAVK